MSTEHMVTPSSRWAADGLPDPHGDRYACERAALALGHLTDDELANAVYLHGNEQPSMADLVAGKALSGIVYLTAAKERIRWLSRALAATGKQQVSEVQGSGLHISDDDRAVLQRIQDSLPKVGRDGKGVELLERLLRESLAARQPGAQEAVEAADPAKDHPGRQYRMLQKLGSRLAELLDEDQWAECEEMLVAIDSGPWLSVARAKPARYLTKSELDSIGSQAEGMDGDQWDRWVQAKFAEVNGLATVDSDGVPALAAPPAPGIDLGQFRRALEWSEDAADCSPHPHHKEYRNSLRELLDLIDGHPDAAPGVRISQGTHDPSGVGNG